MKKTWMIAALVIMIAVSGCDLILPVNQNDDDTVYFETVSDVVSLELMEEADLDPAIEEEIEIDLAVFGKYAPGPGGNNGNGRRRVKLGIKQQIDTVIVSYDTEYLTDDTALVSLTKEIEATLFIRHKDTSMTQDTMIVWEKPYHYVLSSKLLLAADSVFTDSAALDSIHWKVVAKSLSEGVTDSMTNAIEGVQLVVADSIYADFSDPEALVPVVRGAGRHGAFRGRPESRDMQIFAEVSGSEDVKVVAYSGRSTELADDGAEPDLTAEDLIYSGTVKRNFGRDRLRVRVIGLSTFLEEDAPVAFATWMLPVR